MSMFYLVAYGFAVIAAFAVITAWYATRTAKPLTCPDGLASDVDRPFFAGDLHVHPTLAFAGIPLTSLFAGKVRPVRRGRFTGGQTWLVIAGVITSMILAFPYLRVVVMMWLSEPG